MSDDVKQFQVAWNLSGFGEQIKMDGVIGPVTKASASIATRKLNVKDSSLTNLYPLIDALKAYRKYEIEKIGARNLDMGNPFDRLVSRFNTEGKPIGVDVSSCQGKVTDFKLMKAENPWLSFGICRATQGSNFTDDSFDSNVDLCNEAGLALGVYSVINPSEDAEAQAKHAISVMKAASANPKLFLVDFETSHGRDLDAITSRVHVFEQAVQAEFPNAITLIYTYPGYILEFGSRFSDDDFALATYSGQPTPAKCQITSQRTWMYQFSGWTGPMNAKGNFGIRLRTTLGITIPVDHDVALSPELIAAFKG